MTEDPENEADCETQNAKAKSEIVARISRIVRRAGLDYDGWRYVAQPLTAFHATVRTARQKSGFKTGLRRREKSGLERE
jgi:hypothetical protein